MGNDDNEDRERAVRDRIASFMQADEPVQSRQATDEELQTLRAAAGRLDQLLADAAEAEQIRSTPLTDEELQTLRAAARRLDQLLMGIAGKGSSGCIEAAPRFKKDMTE